MGILKGKLIQLLVAVQLISILALAKSDLPPTSLCVSALSGESAALTLKPAPHQERRSLADITHLNIVTFNMENFFQYMGRYIRSAPNELKFQNNDFPSQKNLTRKQRKRLKNAVLKQQRKSQKRGKAHKPPKHTEYIARILKDELEGDLIFLQEIESVKGVLTSFSESHLDGEYTGIVNLGNDNRIAVGSLFERSLPFAIETRSFAHLEWDDPADENMPRRIFSRDAAVNIVRVVGVEYPILITINTHSKSKRPRPNDHESTRLRTAQFEAIANQIVPSLRSEFGEDAPIMVVGDMNTNVVTSPELDAIRNAGFTDALEVVGMPIKKRVTHTYHGDSGPALKHQLDAIYLSKPLLTFLEDAGIHEYRFENGKGNVRPIPNTIQERLQQPSDHRAMYANLRIVELVEQAIKKSRIIRALP